MIEQTLERIAAAMERQAAALEKLGTAQTFTFQTETAPAAPVVVEAAPVTTTTPAPVEKKDDAERNNLKVELHKRGIPFSERARTETLRQLLANPPQAAEKAEQVTAPAPEPTVAVPVEVVGKSPDIMDVRNALIKVKDTVSEETAKKILVTFGEAEKLSLVKPEKYAIIIKACKEAFPEDLPASEAKAV